MEIDDKIKLKLFNYLKENEIKSDDDIHKFSDDLGIDTPLIELEVYRIVQTLLRGGKSFDKGFEEKDADKKQFDMGVLVEYEHVNKDSFYAKLISSKISLDHLAESDELKNPGYYSMLKLMEYCQGKGITVEEIKNKLDIKEDVENMKENKLKEKNYKIGDDVFFKNGNDKDIAEIIDIVDNDEYVLRSEAWVKDIQTDKKTLDLYNESTQSKKSKILKECVNMQVLQSELNRVKDLIKQLKMSKVNDQELKYWLEYEWYLLQIASQEIDSIKQVRDLVSQVINDSSEVENIGPTKDASVFIRNNAFTESMKKKLGLKNVELKEIKENKLREEVKIGSIWKDINNNDYKVIASDSLVTGQPISDNGEGQPIRMKKPLQLWLKTMTLVESKLKEETAPEGEWIPVKDMGKYTFPYSQGEALKQIGKDLLKKGMRIEAIKYDKNLYSIKHPNGQVVTYRDKGSELELVSLKNESVIKEAYKEGDIVTVTKNISVEGKGKIGKFDLKPGDEGKVMSNQVGNNILVAWDKGTTQMLSDEVKLLESKIKESYQIDMKYLLGFYGFLVTAGKEMSLNDWAELIIKTYNNSRAIEDAADIQIYDNQTHNKLKIYNNGYKFGIKESKLKEDQKTDIKSDIEKVMKKGENGYFILTRKQLEDISNKYKVELEDIFQYGDKLSNGDWEFQSLATVVSGIKDNISESKIKESVNSKEFFGQEDWKKDDMSILNYALKEFGYLLRKGLHYTFFEMAEKFASKYPPYANDNFELIYKTLLKYKEETIKVDGLTGKSSISLIIR